MMPQITEAQIASLVDHFYARIRQDLTLGPVFEAAIGSDWDAHLAKLRRFWSAVMLRSGAYHGDPYTAHLRLPGLTPAMFESWLALFEGSCRDLFPEQVAQAFIERAQRIARSLRMGLFERLPPRSSAA